MVFSVPLDPVQACPAWGRVCKYGVKKLRFPCEGGGISGKELGKGLFLKWWLCGTRGAPANKKVTEELGTAFKVML